MSAEANVLNIIHPYTFHMKGDSLIIGGCEEFSQRDERISEFIRQCLDKDVKTVCHFMKNAHPFQHIAAVASLKSDPNYSFLLEKGVKKVYTTGRGIPIPDEKPPDINDKSWDWFQKRLTSNKQFSRRIGKSKNLVFIGGVLESCIANIAHYCSKNYSEKKLQMGYIPEFCVSLDQQALKEIFPEFEKMSFRPLTPENALETLLE